MMQSKSTTATIVKLALIGLAWAVGQMLAWRLIQASPLTMPQMPGEMDPGRSFVLLILGSFVMAIGLAAIACRLNGRWWERWLVLAAFVFVIMGIGNALEARIFTNLGGDVAAALGHLPSALLAGLITALLFRPRSTSSLVADLADFFHAWKIPSLAGRLVLAWLAFPFVYFLFGLIISRIVVPYYSSLDFLVIPPVSVILKTLAVRSALLLAASLPIIAGWKGSRGQLILALGLAHFVVVGAVGLIQAPFFPLVMRLTHTVEILADSFCYAWVLVWIFYPRQDSSEETRAAHAAAT